MNEEFDNNSKLLAAESDSVFTVWEVVVPTKIQKVELSTLHLKKIEDDRIVLLAALDKKNRDDYTTALISISNSHLNGYVITATYVVKPVYPDSCIYHYEIRIGT